VSVSGQVGNHTQTYSPKSGQPCSVRCSIVRIRETHSLPAVSFGAALKKGRAGFDALESRQLNL